MLRRGGAGDGVAERAGRCRDGRGSIGGERLLSLRTRLNRGHSTVETRYQEDHTQTRTEGVSPCRRH